MDNRCVTPRAARAFLVAVALLVSLGTGCVPQSASQDEGNVGLDPNAFPNLRIVGEPNDTFSQPLDVVFDANGYARLRGSINPSSDVDVYALGALSAGDRVIIDVAASQRLDAAIAVFDEGGRLVFENDDRSTSLNQLDPFLNQVVRQDSSVFFLGITSSPFAPGTGTYDMTVQVVRGGTAPAPVPQTLILDFRGGRITIPGDATYTVGAFNTADIASVYTGMTAAVREQIARTVRENFEGLALSLIVLPGDTPPPGCASTVYFGGRNPNAYGTSQDVDPYNQNPCDHSIIFTEMFTPSRFGRVLSAEELGTAIGNVATHEVGHLLGLNHVANVYDLMDTTGGASTFLYDQEFIESPLDYTIFPIGTQDSLTLLLLTIGAFVP